MNIQAITITILLLLASATVVQAQSSITFEDLATRLDPYFAPELVHDIKGALPQSPFDVWGYDVGDFSGDSAYDVAIVIRMRNDRGRKMLTYFFIDDQGILKVIQQESYNFVELPVEVGVSIYRGSFFVTRKVKEFQWEINGYNYRDGVVMAADRFTTERQGLLTYETYRNYQTLESYERYMNVNDEQTVFRSDFLTIPCYGRGRDVSSGYQSTATVSFSKDILNGSYFWKGEEDLSVSVRSAYDEEYIYFNIFVRDDQLMPVPLNDVDSTADRVEIWLDTYILGDRLRVGHRSRDFRTKTDSNIYAFTVLLGDLLDQPAKVKISTSNALDDTQARAAKAIKAVALQQKGGYTVKVRIPFTFLGFPTPPVDDSTLTSLGMTIVAHDIDNSYRPEESTTVATSQKFEPAKPATFGALVLVPSTRHYGEARNIFVGDVRERLKEVGF